ncbi:MAG: hypothetical protein ABFD79_12410 [Phycisphaerales bacterium]
MGIEEMVGAMRLTFFCNKCVEIFYRFRIGQEAKELKQICEMATLAFKSLKWPQERDVNVTIGQSAALFNTNEEIESFKIMMATRTGTPEKYLNEIIDWLSIVQMEEKPMEERKSNAEKLQGFFDTLGDHSFYASRECQRDADFVLYRG